MSACECRRRLAEVRELFDQGQERYESAMHEDGPFWARWEAGNTSENLRKYFGQHQIPECECGDYSILERVRELVGYDAEHGGIFGHGQRATRDNTHFLLGRALE